MTKRLHVLYVQSWCDKSGTSQTCIFSILNLFINYMFQICRDTRAASLEQSLRKLGVERLSKEDVQKMQWEVLEAKIGNWIHYMRIAVRMSMNFLFYLFYFWSHNCFQFYLNRSNCCFRGKRKSVIKYLMVLIL